MKEIESSAVAAAENGNLPRALALLVDGAARFPTRGSLFNNRAQVHRMMGSEALALADLDTAIKVEGAWVAANAASRGTALHEKHRHVLQQAYTQRAILKQ